MKPLIRIADTQFAHGKSLGSGSLMLPPKHFDWYRGNEKQPNDIIFITESCFHLVDTFTENIKIAWLVEPRAIDPKGYEFISDPRNAEKFTCMLSHDKTFVSTLRNHPEFWFLIYYYPFGGCWIYPDQRRVHQKTKNISIIASPKRATEGHRLRHEIIEKFGDRIDGVYNDPHSYLGPNKIEALRDYRYSIVVENCQTEGFFTEKLIDCYMTGTIPVYWRAKSTKSLFCPTSMLHFENIEDLRQLFDTHVLHPDFYQSRFSAGAIHEAYNAALPYTCPEDWIYENILKAKNLL